MRDVPRTVTYDPDEPDWADQIALGDCGLLRESCTRARLADRAEVGHMRIDVKAGSITLDGRPFPYLIAEHGPTIETNGTGFPTTVVLPAIFLVEHVEIVNDEHDNLERDEVERNDDERKR